ncbi:transposase [Bradyrhizobium sp. DASA03007]|uniref:transposase n=1 Tax=unclassified Bradyrhizobium TaxID=2631580 RepID=UPI003F72C0A3
MYPLYVAGLIGPGDRKSVQPIAERLATSNYDQLHHFIADGVWDATPLETELLNQAEHLTLHCPRKVSARSVLRLNTRRLSVNRKLPNPGVFDACARRSASDGRVTSLSA